MWASEQGGRALRVANGHPRSTRSRCVPARPSLLFAERIPRYASSLANPSMWKTPAGLATEYHRPPTAFCESPKRESGCRNGNGPEGLRSPGAATRTGRSEAHNLVHGLVATHGKGSSRAHGTTDLIEERRGAVEVFNRRTFPADSMRLMLLRHLGTEWPIFLVAGLQRRGLLQ